VEGSISSAKSSSSRHEDFRKYDVTGQIFLARVEVERLKLKGAQPLQQ